MMTATTRAKIVREWNGGLLWELRQGHSLGLHRYTFNYTGC